MNYTRFVEIALYSISSVAGAALAYWALSLLDEHHSLQYAFGVALVMAALGGISWLWERFAPLTAKRCLHETVIIVEELVRFAWALARVVLSALWSLLRLLLQVILRPFGITIPWLAA